MATTITPAVLTVSISENITLNGAPRGGVNTTTIAGITNVSKNIVTCLTSAEVAILGVTSAVSTDLGKSYLAGQYDEDSVRYIRITNLDDSEYVLLTMRTSGDSGVQEVCIKLDKGASFLYGVDKDSGTEATIWGSNTAISAATGTTIYNLIDIVGIANTTPVELEVFVASVPPA